MDWVVAIKLGLQLVLSLVDWVKDRQQFNAGQDAEIAKASLAILKKTDAGKRLMEKIDAMGDDELGDLVDALGRDGDK